MNNPSGNAARNGSGISGDAPSRGAELPVRGEPGKPARQDSRPVFIQAMWRTGSTYIWKKFREQAKYRAYYEPLHHSLVKNRAENLAEHSAAVVASLRHPRVEHFYFAEFPFTVSGGAAFFEKALSYERYCLAERENDEALHRYITYLIEFARLHGQTPALQLNRGMLRAGWLTRNFQPINLLLLRRPANVWKSFLSFESHSFTTLFTMVMGQNQHRAPLHQLPRWVEIPHHTGPSFEEEYAYYRPIAVELETQLYPVFFDFYLLAILHSARTADCILDLDELSTSARARRAATERLDELGIRLDLADCALPGYRLTEQERRAWGAHEDYALSFLPHLLPAECILPREIRSAHQGMLSGYFEELFHRFTLRESALAACT